MSDTALHNSILSSALDTLISAHDGDVALLYLYLLRVGSFDAERAARELCRTRREIDAAAEKLSRLSLMPSALSRTDTAPQSALPAISPAARESAPQSPSDELPEYRAEDLVRRSRTDDRFAAILSEAQKVMGRALSSVDMKTLFGIYDYLGLPADVIMLLINHVAKRYHDRYGTSRRPGARAIQKEAYFWANREILTVEQAEDYIRAADERKSALAEVKAALGITGRELTKTESDYISSWLDSGYTAQTIAVAYDRTVTNTGSLRWSYMNRIILSWKEKGLYTLEDIEQKDSRRRAPDKGAAAPARGSRPADFKDLDSLLDKI